MQTKKLEILKDCRPVNCDTCGHRKDNPICQHDISLPEISKIKRDQTVPAGSIIYNSGDMIDAIYSVRSGLVKLETYSSSGASHTVQLVGPGAAFGYRNLFSEAPSKAAAIALEETELCLIPKISLLPIIANRKEILISLVSKLSDSVTDVEKKWLNQMDKGAVERIAEALVFLFENFGEKKWTRRDIAQWAGTTPETVIRTLAQFEREQLIDQSDGRAIAITDFAGLKLRYNI